MLLHQCIATPDLLIHLLPLINHARNQGNGFLLSNSPSSDIKKVKRGANEIPAAET